MPLATHEPRRRLVPRCHALSSTADSRDIVEAHGKGRDGRGILDRTMVGSGGADPETEENATVNERPSAAVRSDGHDASTPSDAVAAGSLPARVPSLTGVSGMTSSTAVGSPVEALRRAEILSTRQFCRIGLGLAVTGAVSVALLPGHPISTAVLLVVMATAAAAMIYLFWRTNDPLTFHRGHGVSIGWYVPALAVSAAVPYFGPFSPVGVIQVLGVYFTSLGRSTAVAFSIYITCAATHGVIGILVILDKIDPGFVPVDTMPLRVQILCQFLVQAVLLGTFLTARAGRRSS